MMNEQLDRDLSRLSEKLGWLRALDGDHRASSPSSLASFGASRHGHRLAPRIELEELIRFEASIGARLPEDYRAFLLQIGNGGAGPYYGLEPLAIWETHEAPMALGTLDEAALQAWYERGAPVRAADPRREFVLESPFYSLELANNTCLHHPPPGGAHPLDGCILLCHTGCGETCFLVVRGARSGEVWIDQSQAAWPIRCVGKTFVSWYEHHLDLTLGTALARAIRRCLVRGGSVSPALLADVAPIVQAKASLARAAKPDPQSDEDLEITAAKAALAFLLLARGSTDEATEDVGPLYAALASGGAERGLEVIDRTGTPSPELLEARARLVRRLGRDEEALLAWDAAMARARFDWDLPRHKAWLQLELGDHAGAEGTLLRMAREHQTDREDALESAERVTEFASALEGADATPFKALAARLLAEAEALPTPGCEDLPDAHKD